MGVVGIGHAPKQREVPGPFFEQPRDETLYYEVPAATLAVREPRVPSFNPVTPFKLQPEIEIIDPNRYWNLEVRNGKLDQRINTTGPGGTLAYAAEGDFGDSFYLYYSGWYETWPAGRYLLSLQIRGTEGLSAAVNLSDGYAVISPTTPLPLEAGWRRVEIPFTINGPFKKHPQLRLWLPKRQTGSCSFADVHLKRVDP